MKLFPPQDASEGDENGDGTWMWMIKPTKEDL